MFESFARNAGALAALIAYFAAPATAQYVLSQGGLTGVAAMQMTVASATTVVIIDKFEQNPLHDSADKPVWGAVYSTASDTVRPLHLVTNSFCATGTWLSNGTLVNLGGNPVVSTANATSGNGIMGVRFYNPCADSGNCDVYESPYRIRLTSYRWYPSSARLSDGSVLIYGGANGGSWTNFDPLNNPSYEFFPPKNINGYNGMKIPAPFLEDSLPHNMFPHMMLLPNNDVFIAANNKTMTLNWQTNTETRLPDLPNGQRVAYPLSGVGVLLPLTPENNYTPEVLLCGGSEIPDSMPNTEIKAQQTPASQHCARIVLTAAGIAAGWSSELMPQARVMPDATILPDGKILIVNGAQTGTAGYGNFYDVVGQSNADNPVFTPVLYDPAAASGSRFSSAGMPTSSIPRMYHSVSTLLPDGRVMIAGSNPNEDVSTIKYHTEYQVEYISPPYMTKPRPTYTGLPATWNYGQDITLTVTLPLTLNPPAMTVSLMDLGFSTHGVHMDMRMVKLKCTLASNRRSLIITGPPNAAVYPPGPAWVYVLFNGVPSKAQKVLIGNGNGPPVDQGAIDYMLANTGGP